MPVAFSETFKLKFFALRLGNRIMGDIVLIETKKPRIFRQVLLTPDNSKIFAESINQKISKAEIPDAAS